MFTILLVIGGLLILIAGAEGLVRGSASTSAKLRIPPIVIGLTIVAFGTSAPELIVNIFAAIRGSADIGIGNIIGSNIANILLILGIASLIYPLSVKSNTVWKEIPFALLAMILVYTMGNDDLIDGTGFNALTRTDGFSLMAIFAIFMVYIVNVARSGRNAIEEKTKTYSWTVSLLYILGGLIGLFFGGKFLVDGAMALARLAGLSEAFIGLTIVAVGTSLPELATSVVAALRRHDDIAVGNIVGSNIFNVFWILGLTSTILQLPFNPTTNIDVLFALAATVLLFIFMFVGTRKKMDRWQGALFIVLYIFYIVYLIHRG